MKILATFLMIACVEIKALDQGACLREVFDLKAHGTNTKIGDECNAVFAGFTEDVAENLLRYAMRHVKYSYEYLFLSNLFAGAQNNRPGLSMFFFKLSNKMWDDATDMLRHLAERGGKFKNFPTQISSERQNLKFTIIEALAYTLDTQKNLSDDANYMMKIAITRGKPEYEVASYIDKFFNHKTNLIRKLSGYIRDLTSFYMESMDTTSVAIFIFDDYLEKSLKLETSNW